MTNSASSICNSFFGCIVLYFFAVYSCFQEKPTGDVSTFTMGNYPQQPVTASLFFNSVDLAFLMEI